MSPTATDRPGTMSVPQAAKKFGISRGLAYDLAAANQFPVRIIRAGRRLLVPTAEVEKALGVSPVQADELPVTQATSAR
jgi:predicted DNA-binding transcriptional regulator AlpA